MEAVLTWIVMEEPSVPVVVVCAPGDESVELATVEEILIWPHMVTGLPLAVKSDNSIWPAILK